MEATEEMVSILPDNLNNAQIQKINKSITLLLQNIAESPLEPYNYLKLGECYLYTQRFNDCIDTYKKYTQFLPNDEYAWNRLGLAYAAINKNVEAKECFIKALKINRSFYKASNNLNVIKRKMGEG